VGSLFRVLAVTRSLIWSLERRRLQHRKRKKRRRQQSTGKANGFARIVGTYMIEVNGEDCVIMVSLCVFVCVCGSVMNTYAYLAFC